LLRRIKITYRNFAFKKVRLTGTPYLDALCGENPVAKKIKRNPPQWKGIQPLRNTTYSNPTIDTKDSKTGGSRGGGRGPSKTMTPSSMWKRTSPGGGAAGGGSIGAVWRHSTAGGRGGGEGMGGHGADRRGGEGILRILTDGIDGGEW